MGYSVGSIADVNGLANVITAVIRGVRPMAVPDQNLIGSITLRVLMQFLEISHVCA